MNNVDSYFDLVKPISIPHTAVFHDYTDCNNDADDADTLKDLPEYLQSFHGSGISDARLKRFNWLHPKNYSGEGSLSDDYTLSPYGTSVSSPRGDDWEIIDRGPRKPIDELWDEVFEYQERIKLLEQVHEASLAQSPLSIEEGLLNSEPGQQRQRHTAAAIAWSEYGGASETCYSPSSLLMTAIATSGNGCTTKIKNMTTFGQTPISTSYSYLYSSTSTSAGTHYASETMTQVERINVYASRKGVRSDRGAALRLLQAALGYNLARNS